MNEHPPTPTPMRDATLLEREAARVIRNAVSDFERETLSLSAVEHLLRRLGNCADILDRTDRPILAAPEPQPLRVNAIACPDCGFSTRAHGDRFSRVCENDECPRVFVNVTVPS